MGLDYQQVLQKIKERGYWRILFEPVVELPELDYEQCKKIMKETQVKIRGWYFPHFHLYDLMNVKNGIHAATIADEFIEAFKFFFSHQFIDYKALTEDWLEQASFFQRNAFKPYERIDFIGILFCMTEFFELCLRLAERDILGSAVKVNIGLFKTQNRCIFSWDPLRPIFDSHVCEEPSVVQERIFTKDQLVAQADEYAIEWTKHIFDLFQWENVSIDVLQKEQKKILKRR